MQRGGRKEKRRDNAETLRALGKRREANGGNFTTESAE
jgi:hypothetical protein